MEAAMFNAATPDEVLEPIDAKTVCEAFRRCATQNPDKIALRTPSDSISLTWAQLDTRVQHLAGAFAGLGLGRGDTLAILLANTVECHLVDYAAMHLGAVPFTIYASSTAEQVGHQLANGGACIVVTDAAGLKRIEEVRAQLPSLEHIVVVGEQGGTTTLADLEATVPAGFDAVAAARAVKAEDLVTLVYTSGTTGPPKAAQWAHRTVMSQLRALAAALPMPDLGVVSFLPMAHAAGRISSHYAPLVHGATITVCPDQRDLASILPQARPDALFAMPRSWEEVQIAVEGLVEQLPENEREAAHRAFVSGDVQGQTAIVPVLEQLGLDRVKVAFVAGARSAASLSQFFRNAGVPLLEAYGLAEGSLMIFNRIERFKPGTVGWALPGVETELGDDGELLVRGPLNFVSYRNNPEQTSAAFDADGWLRTGDIAVVDEEGYVTIVDRKETTSASDGA